MIIGSVNWSDEVAKGAINFGFVAILGGAFGLLWGIARHRRELDLDGLGRFHDVYGKWFAVWKRWESAVDQYKDPRNVPQADRAVLLEQATEAEGEFEALLVKVVTERRLSDGQARRLGRFREGYQRLRESLEKPARLPFRVLHGEAERGAYVTFKALSVEFAALLRTRNVKVSRPKSWKRPRIDEAQDAFVKVTSWRVSDIRQKDTWWSDPGDDKLTGELSATLHNLNL